MLRSLTNDIEMTRNTIINYTLLTTDITIKKYMNKFCAAQFIIDDKDALYNK